MKIIKPLGIGILVILAIVATYVKLRGVSYTTSLDQQALQQKIGGAIPARTELTGGVLHVTGVVVGFDSAGNRLRVQLAMELEPTGPVPRGPPPLPGPPGRPPGPKVAETSRIPVAIELLASLAYKPETGEIAIKNAELGTFGGDGLPEAIREPVRQVATRVLAKALEDRAITTMEAGSAARLVLDRLWIEGDRLWIGLKLGG